MLICGCKIFVSRNTKFTFFNFGQTNNDSIGAWKELKRRSLFERKSVCLSCASTTHRSYAADTQPIRLIPPLSRFHSFDVFALDTQPIRLIPLSSRFHPFDVFALDTQPIGLIPPLSRFHPFDVFALDTQPIRSQKA
jgi:hypothetical protein